MINNIIYQFSEEIINNLKLFELSINIELIKTKLNELFEIIHFNEISNDKLMLYLCDGNSIYKLFYQYNELKKIKEDLRNNLNETNEEKYKKLKSLFRIIKSERNGYLIKENGIKFEKCYNIVNLFTLFQYKINHQIIEKKLTLKDLIINNPEKINESFVIFICEKILKLIEECQKQNLILFNLSINSIFFINNNLTNIYFNDFSKSKYLYKKAYEYKNNFYLKRELFKVDIFDLGKIMFNLLSKNENEDENIYNKVSSLKNVSQNMQKLILKMIEQDIIRRYNIFQVNNLFNTFFFDEKKKTDILINKKFKIKKNFKVPNFLSKKKERENIL